MRTFRRGQVVLDHTELAVRDGRRVGGGRGGAAAAGGLLLFGAVGEVEEVDEAVHVPGDEDVDAERLLVRHERLLGALQTVRTVRSGWAGERDNACRASRVLLLLCRIEILLRRRGAHRRGETAITTFLSWLRAWRPGTTDGLRVMILQHSSSAAAVRFENPACGGELCGELLGGERSGDRGGRTPGRHGCEDVRSCVRGLLDAQLDSRAQLDVQ
jgi:hypothetical protein